jgi:2-methylisocitrate lyase-like PEP mutase family enzyme
VKVPCWPTSPNSAPRRTTLDELRNAGVAMVLYPLSAFRAMNKAAENVYQAIRRDGTQKNVVDTMQTRMAARSPTTTLRAEARRAVRRKARRDRACCAATFSTTAT